MRAGGWRSCVAIIGSNRKLLIFPLEQVPEMARGGGVILQRYRVTAWLADAKTFNLADDASPDLAAGPRRRSGTETNLGDWVGERAQAGRLPPNGFPRTRAVKAVSTYRGRDPRDLR